MTTEASIIPGSLLTLGLEPEGVRACLLDVVNGQHRLVGWLGLQHDPSLELPALIARTCQRLGSRLGRRLWHEERHEPLLESDDPVRFPPLDQVLFGMTPRGRVRVWIAGLSEHYSLTALEYALASSPAQIVGRTQLSTQLSSEQLRRDFVASGAEALVVAGGVDEPLDNGEHPLLTLCAIVGEMLAGLPIEEQPLVIYAGSRALMAQAIAKLQQGENTFAVDVVDNLLPTPDQLHVRPLATALTYLSWRLGERAAGLSRFNRWITPPSQVSSLATNFAQLNRVWLEHHEQRELHGLYCTSAWWLHVWVRQSNELTRLWYTEPEVMPAGLADWPPVQLICGDGRWVRAHYQSNQTQSLWWDRIALAPIIATVGQVAPAALLQVLQHDIFEQVR